MINNLLLFPTFVFLDAIWLIFQGLTDELISRPSNNCDWSWTRQFISGVAIARGFDRDNLSIYLYYLLLKNKLSIC